MARAAPVLSAAALVLGLGWAQPVGAFEELIPARLFIAKPEGRLVKMVAAPSPGETFPLPTESPGDVTVTLRVMDTNGIGGDDAWSVSASFPSWLTARRPRPTWPMAMRASPAGQAFAWPSPSVRPIWQPAFRMPISIGCRLLR